MVELNIKVYKDGDKFYALMGEDVQEGVAGVGNTPEQALQNFLDNLELKEYFRPD